MKRISLSIALLYAAASIPGALVLSAPPKTYAASKQKDCSQKAKRGGLPSVLSGLGANILDDQLRKNGVRMDYQLRSEVKTLLTDTLACALTEGEQDQAVQAQERALDGCKSGQPGSTRWSSKDRNGVKGGTEVKNCTVVAGQNCATSRTFITDVDGKEKAVEQELCEQSDGTWA